MSTASPIFRSKVSRTNRASSSTITVEPELTKGAMPEVVAVPLTFSRMGLLVLALVLSLQLWNLRKWRSGWFLLVPLAAEVGRRVEVGLVARVHRGVAHLALLVRCRHCLTPFP